MYFLNASRNHTQTICSCLLFLLFYFFCALSSFFHRNPPELMWLWLCTKDGSFLPFQDISMYGKKVVKFVARWLKITDKKDLQVFWFRNDDSKRLCVRAFFFKPGGFPVELYWKSFALKNRLENEASCPQPLNISILARHPMPACCWHIDWRSLACLPVIPCNQPTTVPPYTSIFPFSPHFNLSLEGSFQPQVGVGSV